MAEKDDELPQDGTIYIELEIDEESSTPIPSYESDHPQLKNLARDLDKEQVERIGSKVMDEYREDESARKEWIEKLAMYLRVYNQEDTQGTRPPFPGASKDHVPILPEAIAQFYNRAVQLLFGQSEFIRSRPFGNITKPDLEAAKRIEKYMNYYFMVRDKKYKTRLKEMLKAVPLWGSVVRKRYWNPETKRIEVQNIEPQNFIAPIGSGPCHVSELPHKIHRYKITHRRARELYQLGYFNKAIRDADASNTNPDAITETQAENLKATSVEQQNLGKMVTILEYHGYCDLEGDKMERPYIVWVHEETGDVLRIAARYRIDKRERAYDPEQGYGANANRNKPLDYKPIEYFTHFYFSTNPNGWYGEGMGTLLAPQNQSINRIIRQIIDAGTLANIPSGLISKQAGINKGEIEVKLGEFTPVDATVDDLKKAIYQFEFRGPNPAYMQILEALIARTDRLGMLTSAVTGETDKVIQPTTFINLIEQSLQPFSAAMQNIQDCLSEELAAIYEMMSWYMEEEEYFAILDGDEIEVVSVAPMDFQMDLDLQVVADPKLATDRQRQEKAQKVFEVLMSNPVIQQSPQHMNAAYRMLLEAYDVPNIEELLPPDQPPAPPPGAGPQMPEASPAGIPGELLAQLSGEAMPAPQAPEGGGMVSSSPNPVAGPPA